MKTMAEIVVGAMVVTADGKELGHVAEVREGALRVDVERRRDYWLAETEVLEATPETVTLLVSEGDLSAYKMDKPNDPNEFESGIPDNLDPANVSARAAYEGGSRLR
jgi:hypothetical protein